MHARATKQPGKWVDSRTKRLYAKSKLDPQGGTKGEKVLVLAWDCENDTLHFNFQHIADKAKGLEATKRNLLSLLARLFDPLGMVSPVTVGMKVLFQEICNSKFDWDEVLMGEIKQKWDKWVQDLAETKEICIDRCLYETGGGDVTECYLHGFGDASKKAYCAMVCFVYRTKDGKAHVRLVASKTRVAPLKELSIPRLELSVGENTCAAHAHSEERVTVTSQVGWREVLAGQQDSSQLDTKQGRMEAVRAP